MKKTMLKPPGFYGKCLHHEDNYRLGWNLIISNDLRRLIPRNIRLTIEKGATLYGVDVLTHLLYKILSDNDRKQPVRQAILWLKLSFPKLSKKERRLLVVATVDWIRQDMEKRG